MMKKINFLIVFLFFSFAIIAQAQDLTPQEKRSAIIEYAKTFLGTPYAYAGASRNGMDCSGFILTVFKDTLQMDLPRTASQMHKYADPIPRNQLERGDLVFFKPSSSNSITHVGIYWGQNQMIHSASEGSETGVIISSLDERYWARTYYSAGRILPAGNLPEVVQQAVQFNATPKNEKKNLNREEKSTSRNTVKTFKNVAFEISAQGNWFLFNSKGFNAEFKGGSIIGGLRFNGKMLINAGVRYDTTFDVLSFPILLGIGLPKNFWFMVGVTVPSVSDADIPLYVGISWNREVYKNDVLALFFTQDFSYTGYDSNTFSRWFSDAPEKMNFSTGLKVVF